MFVMLFEYTKLMFEINQETKIVNFKKIKYEISQLKMENEN